MLLRRSHYDLLLSGCDGYKTGSNFRFTEIVKSFTERKNDLRKAVNQLRHTNSLKREVISDLRKQENLLRKAKTTYGRQFKACEKSSTH